MNKDWNSVRGIFLSDDESKSKEKRSSITSEYKVDLKIKRIVDFEFRDIVFTKEPTNINKYYKWINS